MNVTSAGGISDVQAAAITADVAALLGDVDLGATVTVETPGTRSMDPRTGMVSGSRTSDAVTAWWSPLSARETGADAAYEVGDRRLTVAASDLNATPTTATLLRDGSTRYAVVAVETAQIGGSTLFYHLIARKSG